MRHSTRHRQVTGPKVGAEIREMGKQTINAAIMSNRDLYAGGTSCCKGNEIQSRMIVLCTEYVALTETTVVAHTGSQSHSFRGGRK